MVTGYTVRPALTNNCPLGKVTLPKGLFTDMTIPDFQKLMRPAPMGFDDLRHTDGPCTDHLAVHLIGEFLRRLGHHHNVISEPEYHVKGAQRDKIAIKDNVTDNRTYGEIDWVWIANNTPVAAFEIEGINVRLNKRRDGKLNSIEKDIANFFLLKRHFERGHIQNYIILYGFGCEEHRTKLENIIIEVKSYKIGTSVLIYDAQNATIKTGEHYLTRPMDEWAVAH